MFPEICRKPPLFVFLCFILTSCSVFRDVAEGLGEVCSQSLLSVTTNQVYSPRPADLCDKRTGACLSLAQAVHTALLCGEGQQISLLSDAVYRFDRPIPAHPRVMRLQRDAELQTGPTGVPVIFNSILIDGNGAVLVREVDSSGELGEYATPFRFFYVNPEGRLSLRDLTLKNGLVYVTRTATEDFPLVRSRIAGGALYNEGTARLNNVRIIDNRVRTPAAAPSAGHHYFASGGGAIYNEGRLFLIGGGLHNNFSLSRGTVLNNRGTASLMGVTVDGILNFGAIKNSGQLSLRQTSLGLQIPIHNFADLLFEESQTRSMIGSYSGGQSTIRNATVGEGYHGLICDDFSTASSSITLDSVTVYGTEDFEPTIRTEGFGLQVEGSCEITIRNTVISDNVSSDCMIRNPDIVTITVTGVSMDSDGTCPGFQTVSPQLGPLQDNGGATLTRLPAINSPLIDAGGLNCPSTDQRRFPRDDGDCDVGAVEK